MISIRGLSIDVPGFNIKDLDLDIHTNEFFMIVGPSGAGKTLMLEAIAGLQDISSGNIWVDRENITSLPPEKRNISLVYQDYALFHHLSVLDNITYGLRFKTQKNDHYIDHLITILKLKKYLERKPSTLSGGEQQRVALARALAVNPDLVLLDEPLSALDPSFRDELHDYMRKLHSEGITFVMVTHDFGEVLALGDRVAVIQDGSIHQVGKVQEVFRYPSDPGVAGFVGMKNVFTCTASKKSQFWSEHLSFMSARENISLADAAYIGIRPEDISICREKPIAGHFNLFRGTITSMVSRGLIFEIRVQLGAEKLICHIPGSRIIDMNLKVGDYVNLSIKREAVHIF